MKKEDIQKMKKWLPRGYAKRIYDETGISFVTIYAVFAGRSTNDKVIEAAMRIVAEEKAKNEAMIQLLAKL